MENKMEFKTTLEYKLVNNKNEQRVVQKGNVTKNNCYSLLLCKGQTFVYKNNIQNTSSVTLNSKVLTLTNTAAGHTQTFEYANQSGAWFIGTKGKKQSKEDKYAWDTQIARVQIPASQAISSNTKLPRLSYLNRAGIGKKIDQNGNFRDTFTGNDLLRSEAAVSPGSNYDRFLLATVDTAGNGYFFLYRLADINNALNKAGTADVNIETIPCLQYFAIPKITDQEKGIGSIQGYDLDDQNNIYISSQKSGDDIRHLYKIPWGVSNKKHWTDIPLGAIDVAGYSTELEGVQVLEENDLYLTVAYHRNTDGKATQSRIFRIQEVRN